MQLPLQSELDRNSLNETWDPLKAWASTSELAAKSFTPAEMATLEKLANFSLPSLHLTGAFTSEKIKSDTPDQMAAEVADSNAAVSATLTLLRAARLVPVSFAYENFGQLAVHITPQKPSISDRRGYQKSIGGLRGHTDASFNPSPLEYQQGDQQFAPSPDFLTLACVRNPDNVPTNIATLEEVLGELSQRDIDDLSKRVFILTPQESFRLPATSVRAGAVLWRDPCGEWCCRFSHRNISIDAESFPGEALALKKFSDAIIRCVQPITLGPGDILMLNNRTLVHGRNEIGAEWHPKARWLIRMYANRFVPQQLYIDPQKPWMVQ